MNESITIRLTTYEKSTIKHLVTQGKYKNLSAFVRQSIKTLWDVEKL